MRVALYFRVSTDEQKERASIETQREFAAQYCKVHEITVISSYSDDGISGTIPVAERPDGSRLLSDARAKKFRYHIGLQAGPACSFHFRNS